ncbi:PREDICTED: importin-11 isoform X1 [Prunus mume]|uniref:Importin-11 isoform X1 n=1 Tax=Prunus mume TaxID=102107 RepID=A0ABM0NGQ0_PRUMU|nr:PREDICTED: importin-11 isoform X1 [Prunus mume]
MALSASDLPAMFSLLTNSLSGDDSVRKPAEAALSQSEARPGFCSCLMEVITAKDLVPRVDVRLMASVYFKNSVNRYWRHRRDSSGISNEEKIHLRQKLLSHFREENYQIAQMLAVLVSKIARIDYPKEWPELFSVLAQKLQSTDVLSSHRIFLTLFRTLKELSTKRLISDQKNFAEISSHFFDYSWHLWQSDVQTILHGFSTLSESYNLNTFEQHQDELFLTCERWLLCLKIIRQLVVSGFPSDAKCVQEVRPVKEVSPVLLNAIQSFLPYYSSFQKGHPKFWDFLKRACTKLMKVLIAIQGRHPYSFSDKCVLPTVVDFCLKKITEPEPDVLSFEQFLIQCMVMVKCVLECKEYKPSLTGRVMGENVVTLEQMKKNISGAVSGVLTSLMTSERIVVLCNILIRRYFVLSTNDLEEWYQSPESFHHEQDMVQWTEKLRPCAEALYIVLFENHSQLLGPIVVSILKEAMNGCPTSVTEITPGLLLKDAAYGAAAYVYYELSNYLSFKDWFNGALSLELSNDHPNMRIIHRKVALILGQWVSEIKEDTKRPVYCALIRLLQDKDLSVRLAACRSLCLHIEDASFSEREFIDLLPICWESCFKLIEEVQEFDSKVQVLNLISILIGHMSEVMPFANKLILFFQKVWEESSGECLLQIQLLVALRNFVVALGFQSPICYDILLPILQKGIDIDSPDELNLLEDSMLLWEATLSHAPSMVPQLLAYFPCVVKIMERSFDHLQVAVNITEDYIILGGSEFLSIHASSVAQILDLVVGNVNDRGLLSTLPLIDILIQCFPLEVPQLISSTLQKLIVICLSGGDDQDPSKTAVKASSAAILARILVMNTNYLAHLTSEPSLLLLLQSSGIPTEENVLLCLVDIWLDKADNVSSIQRKTYGLALSIILTLRLPQVLNKLDQILRYEFHHEFGQSSLFCLLDDLYKMLLIYTCSVCTTVILGANDDLTEESSGDNITSSGSLSKGTIPSKEFRRRQLKFSDPINQMSLDASVRENLQTCATLHGESFNKAIGCMHPSAFSQLKQALKMA